jgi:hypothetical protein
VYSYKSFMLVYCAFFAKFNSIYIPILDFWPPISYSISLHPPRYSSLAPDISLNMGLRPSTRLSDMVLRGVVLIISLSSRRMSLGRHA